MVPMPLILNIALVIFFILASFLEYKRLLAKDDNLKLDTALRNDPCLYILLFLSIILVIYIILSIIFHHKLASFYWNMPLWFQYYHTALTWGAIICIFAFLFSLASAISFHTNHPKKWKIVIAGVLLIASIQITQRNYTRPVTLIVSKTTVSSEIIMQTSDVSCAAASAANILKKFGINSTEKRMAELLGTTMTGTTPAQIIYGMRKIGISCHQVEIPDSDPEKVKAPAMFFIAHPSTGPESHVVAYMGFVNGRAEIWDPLYGKMLMDKNHLAGIWQGRGIEFFLEKN